MENLKITIITPSFNQGDFIEETICSVINQNYSNLEYIIIDGGSEDNTKDVVKKYSDRIAYWVSEKDKGQSNAINKGFEKASGDIIAWLNSDDLYCENAIKDVVKLFNENPDVDIIYGDVINFNETGKELYVANQFELFDFFSRVSLHQPGVFWRKKVIDEVGLLNESLHYCMDYDFWMRIFFNYKSLKTDIVFSRFREHDQSKTNNSPLALYVEYQYVISVFFNSIDNSCFKNKLINYGVYFNDSNKAYTLKYNFADNDLRKLFCIFIERCIDIEYTKGNYKVVIALFFKLPTLFFNLKNCLFFSKSLFLIIGKPFKKN
jgi:glycosyltransferase involved in cell wall biosynthesis